MKIIVKATESQKHEWNETFPQMEMVEFVDELMRRDADIYFDLSFDEINPVFFKTSKPVFVNAVASRLIDVPTNYIRINGWPGFLKRPVLEIVSREEQKGVVSECFSVLNRKFYYCPDIPGMIAARIIATIINEAYYTLEENISSKEGIDIAMKLGTNYPYGPFEWSEKIGLERIYFLLKSMQQEDSRYTISDLLVKEAKGV